MSLPTGQGILQLQVPSAQPERIYHARRAHRKSRHGCTQCKQRRVKCDESKPHCLRCQKLHLDCSYRPSPSKELAQLLTSSPDSRAYTLALNAVGTRIQSLLQLPSGASVSVRIQALHHFYGLSDPDLGPEAPQVEFQKRLIQKGFETPFLMHAIIATATSHLRYHHHHSLANHSPQTYRTTESYHWHQAITQYARELHTIGPDNMDGLFSACILLTVRAFELETYDPSSSFVFASHPAPALGWLTVQVGLRRLLEATVAWQRGSMWWDVFMRDSRKYRGIFEGGEQEGGGGGIGSGREEKGGYGDGLDPYLVELCGIRSRAAGGGGGSGGSGNPYYEPVRTLCGLELLEPGMRSFGAYAGWMGRLESSFFEKLIQKEVPALVVLRRWLVLMGSSGLWWVGLRVRSEVEAICSFLGDGEGFVGRG
ncbi:Zn(II)2Cys6 transcription factor domain-containing protein [Aspergillus saccharolyticus JOP 1030-1]|uniref:Zn(2)-C6 fungal-type domain-containing protein n=1 Tax=Aspergillus saccharolyticus JOP 1030-1 TaxID=1450539 RepID=A0A318Z8E0_9EURO|nr:hypothetical protein BP01DRAFT_346582 [Aspergillus saccharolyticus JOP 1030-1]PYH42664.1 hypothetical protein BP01DRAFT_346582 [Aspergillus saccharolyticus JOP 1030-1]